MDKHASSARVNDLKWAADRLGAAWGKAIVEGLAGRQPYIGVASSTHFSLHVEHCLQQRQYGHIARLYEAAAGVDLQFLDWYNDRSLDRLFIAVADVVKAAHWFRKANESERAALAGERALLDLRRIADENGLREPVVSGMPLDEEGIRYHERMDLPYVYETMGDAAVCFDETVAKAYYELARPRFAAMELTERAAQGADYFPGQHISYMLNHFLPPRTDPDLVNDCELRLDYNLLYWLRQ